MLNRLYVRNYALIKELKLDFDRGLTIITGETGAGKSIILGALGLILGNRADSAALFSKREKCIVEGSFAVTDKMAHFFELNDIDFQPATIMRREITVNGRSRAFINDTPVTLELMKELGSLLIDIHSQHQSLMLGDNSFQLGIVDSFADHFELIEQYAVIYRKFREIEKEYNGLKERSDQDNADLEYFTHQLEQLDESGLIEGEEKELEAERELLEHAGEVHESLASAGRIICGEDHAVLNRLIEAKRLLERISQFMPQSDKMDERLESVIIELNDLGNELEVKAGNIESDPLRLEKISGRLDTLYLLMQKHHQQGIGDLILFREELRHKVETIISGDDRLRELERLLNSHRSELAELANMISENRMQVIPDVEEKMSGLLSALGMPNGKFRVQMNILNEFRSKGKDHAEFLFSANKQIVPENLGKVASGGELSRVMLSLKSLLTDNMSLPTIFFDEIDSGVSGEVATRVGQILASMGKRMQVINITHLPQVAALGQMHYYVYKEDDADSTITHIKLLDKKERLNEIARLLSGNEITRASVENAKELIKGA
ncbi:MAG: DNA repair protein RecN [Bacteroidales bacterium]|nr:DNA repair protein RecN [Bacteroidales bacterium]